MAEKTQNIAVAVIKSWGLIILVIASGCSSKLNVYDTNDEVKIITYSTPKFINIHYVETGDKTFLIDCGNVGDSTKVEKFFNRKGIDLTVVDYLIITHGHADHAGNASYFQEKYGMKIIAGSGESAIISAGGFDKDLCPRGFQGWLVKKLIVGPTYRPFSPDIIVDGTLDLASLGVSGKIVETPGHTPGSITTIIGDVAFVGDLIRGKPSNRNKPTYHIFMCDLEDNLQDIETIANEPNVTQWHLGHLGPLSIRDVNTFIKQKRSKSK